MHGKHCRLYDENLVHNIMISTGLSVLEFLREKRNAHPNEVCEYIELQADQIIEETIENLNKIEDMTEDPPENESGDAGAWPTDPEDKA